MSHELELINGQAQMAYAATEGKPWHGLGVPVADDLTPEQMLQAAGLDWKVYTEPCYTLVNDHPTEIGKQALIRDRDNQIMDIISDDWKPFQNEDAFNFFNDFVAAGHMKMDTAGSLKGGRLVWALAKTNEAFELFGGKDLVEGYLHFTNPHIYGNSIDVRTTSIRCVCWNTVSLSLNKNAKSFVKVNHRREFDPEQVKIALGISKEKLMQYKELAGYLSTKRYTDEDMVDYFKRVFPVSGSKDISRNAKLAQDHYLENQVGAELGEGTWWQLVNCVTYMTNHVLGRNSDNRLVSTWYGNNSKINVNAINLAAEMA